MKQVITVMVLCAALLMPAVARAHEGHMHKALGTVSAVDGQHVTLKTTDGKSLMVMLDKETTVFSISPRSNEPTSRLSIISAPPTSRSVIR